MPKLMYMSEEQCSAYHVPVILESDLIFQINLYLVLTCHIIYRFFFTIPPTLFSKDTAIQVTTASYEDMSVCARGSTLRFDENCENNALAAKRSVVGKKKGGQVVACTSGT